MKKSTETKKRALLYKQAKALSEEAKTSGEPEEMKNALLLYKRAAELGLDTPSFWHDYAWLLYDLSDLLNKPEMLVDAVEILWKCVKTYPEDEPACCALARFSGNLYGINPQESYFLLACKSFEALSKMNPYQFTYWFKWGQLLVYHAKLTNDLSSLELAIKKFEAADLCDPDRTLLWANWAESLLLLGIWTQEHSLLKDALQRIERALKVQKDVPALWAIYGDCFLELGKYHDDDRLVLEAVKRYRMGLKLDSKDPVLWHGFALALFTLGSLKENTSLLLESASQFSKVMEFGGERVPRFWNDWGSVLMKLGIIKNEKVFFEEAIEKFEKTLRISHQIGLRSFYSSELKDWDLRLTNVSGTDLLRSMEYYKPEWLYNLGAAYECLGDFEDTPKSYEKSLQLLKKVIEMEPSFTAAYFNLATVCTKLGEWLSDADLLLEANGYFEKVLHDNQEDDEAWTEWGILLLHLAEIMHDPTLVGNSEECYQMAEKKFMHAASLGSIIAFYYLACLYSIRGNYEASIHFLEKSAQNEALPPTESLMADRWLENVRNTSFFRHFLSQFS